MAEKIFQGFELITEANFNALSNKNKQKIYFVRTDTGTTKEDGFIYFNGKKYGTGKLSSKAVQDKLQELKNTVDAHIANKATVTATARTSGTTDNGVLSGDTEEKWLTGTAIGQIKTYVDSEDVKSMVLTEDHKIQLKNNGNVVLAELDATSFIKDGMLQSVTLVNDTTKGNVLRFTWNTENAAGKTVTDIEVSEFFHEISGDTNTITVSQPASGAGSLQISAKTVASVSDVTSGATALMTGGITQQYVAKEINAFKTGLDSNLSLSATTENVTYATANIAQTDGKLNTTGSNLVLNVATGLTREHIGFNFDSSSNIYSAGTTDFAGQGLLDATKVVTILQNNNTNIVSALDYLKGNIYTVSTTSQSIIGVDQMRDESAIGGFTYQISAGPDLNDAITHANSAVQTVNGKSGTSVTISSSDINLDKKIGDYTTSDSVTQVLDDIYTKLSTTSADALTSVNGSGSITVSTKKNNQQSISVKAKPLSETEKAAGQIEIITTGTTGIYGLLYFGGDDVEP